MKLLNQAEETPVIRKTKDLCQAILDQPGYQAMRKSIDDFLAHDASVAQYRELIDRQEALHARYEAGENADPAEVEAFGKLEEAFLANPLAQAFVDAQRKMQELEKTVQKYVRRTFELNRVPGEDDFSSCCGGGCGGH